jgi:hypothetical protein
VDVHIARLLREIAEDTVQIGEDEFESIAWGELYTSLESARRKSM